MKALLASSPILCLSSCMKSSWRFIAPAILILLYSPANVFAMTLTSIAVSNLLRASSCAATDMMTICFRACSL